MNEASNLSDPIIKQESFPIGLDESARPDFKRSDATHILKDLSLSYVVLGDYVVIMNDHEDVTFSGEPYIALQLWFNTKTGNVICRVWNRTIASDKIVNITQLTEACISHLQGRPCLGYPLDANEEMMQEFMIVKTPIPRKVSLKCLKVLANDQDANRKSCNQCLKLGELEVNKKDQDSEVSYFDEQYISSPDNENYLQEEQGHFGKVEEVMEETFKGEVEEESDPVQPQESETDHNPYPCWEELDAQSTASHHKGVVCNKCSKVFKNKRSLHAHMKEKHLVAPEVHLCPVCGASFGRKSNMKAHMQVNCKLSKMQPQNANPGSSIPKPQFRQDAETVSKKKGL